VDVVDSNASVTVRCSIDKPKALSLIVHCADISHPAKTWRLHSRWTELLVEEFFKQVFIDQLVFVVLLRRNADV